MTKRDSDFFENVVREWSICEAGAHVSGLKSKLIQRGILVHGHCLTHDLHDATGLQATVDTNLHVESRAGLRLTAGRLDVYSRQAKLEMMLCVGNDQKRC